jgi:hypothetical protein
VHGRPPAKVQKGSSSVPNLQRADMTSLSVLPHEAGVNVSDSRFDARQLRSQRYVDSQIEMRSDIYQSSPRRMRAAVALNDCDKAVKPLGQSCHLPLF